MSTDVSAPSVSVIVPAYNAAWCIRKAIDSVIAQTFRDFELLVVDDGSTDCTAEILVEYGDAIRVIRQPNGGLARARNAGIHASRAEFVAFLDADDWWLPGKLAPQVALLRARPDVGFASTMARVEDAEGVFLNLWPCPTRTDFLPHLFSANGSVAGSGSAVIARRQLLMQIGCFDESLLSLEDVDMWMRLAAVSGYACIGEPLVVILKTADSMSRNLEVMRAANVQVMKKNRHLLPKRMRGAYWRRCMAGVHGDFAKWRYRTGQRWAAIVEIAQMLRLSPLGQGRLGLGLLRDIALNRQL